MQQATPYDRHLAYRQDLQDVGPRFFVRSRLMRRLLKGHRGRLIDVGCGDGFFLLQLAQMGFQCAGLDASAAMIERCRARVPEADLFCGAIQDYAPSEPFDVAVCGEVLEHIQDDIGMLWHIRRLLKPGGVLVLSVPLDMALWNEADERAGHVRRYTRPEIIAKLTEAGFSPLTYVVWGYPIARALHFRIRREQCELMRQPRPRRLGRLRWLMSWGRYLFLLDHLFNWTERGVGIVVKAVRTTE